MPSATLSENVSRWSLSLEFIFSGIRNGFGKYNSKEHRRPFPTSRKVSRIFNDVSIYGISYDWSVDRFILVGLADLLVYMFNKRIVFKYTARNGLSESELEDILSCDDDVLNDVYQFWKPPLRRLPPLLMARLRTDLQQYLGIFLYSLFYSYFNHLVPWCKYQASKVEKEVNLPQNSDKRIP